jgi:hypothetical protein
MYHMHMTIAGFLALKWTEVEGPLIQPPLFSPVIADPSFLFPEETPDGTWELFAHSVWGIHRYASDDGLAWHDRGIVVRNAMRPFVRRLYSSEEAAAQTTERALTSTQPFMCRLDGSAETGDKTVAEKVATEKTPAERLTARGSTYALYFESYPPFALPLSALPFKRPWNSAIALARSADLASWSPREILLSPELPWMSEPSLGASVSNPCLVEEPKAAGCGHPKSDSGWRLYYSASLSWIPDCGFCEPRYLTLARG